MDFEENKLIIQKDFDNEDIGKLIYTIRGKQVMLSGDIARLYEVETKQLNQAVKRNEKRFPKAFCFQLTDEEYNSLRSQFVTLKNQGRGQHIKYLPYAFTEQGVAMLSAVLHSNKAIEVSINIMNAFIEMRKLILSNDILYSEIFGWRQGDKILIDDMLIKEALAEIASENQCDEYFRISPEGKTIRF